MRAEESRKLEWRKRRRCTTQNTVLLCLLWFFATFQNWQTSLQRLKKFVPVDKEKMSNHDLSFFVLFFFPGCYLSLQSVKIFSTLITCVNNDVAASLFSFPSFHVGFA